MDSLSAMRKIWSLPEGMAVVMDREAMAEIARSEMASAFDGPLMLTDIEEMIAKVERIQGVTVTDRMDGTYTVCRPAPRPQKHAPSRLLR